MEPALGYRAGFCGMVRGIIEDRIVGLCQEAAWTNSDERLHRILLELRLTLHQHAQLLGQITTITLGHLNDAQPTNNAAAGSGEPLKKAA